MSETPELDQVTDARRRIAAHAGFPTAYWVLHGVALVLVAGLPIWMSWPNGAGATGYATWALAALAIGSAAYSVLRRRRSGVYLPKRIGSYPGALRIWLLGILIAVAGFGGIAALVAAGHRGAALGVLPVVAVAVLVTQIRTRSAMRRDIEAGRVRP